MMCPEDLIPLVLHINNFKDEKETSSCNYELVSMHGSHQMDLYCGMHCNTEESAR